MKVVPHSSFFCFLFDLFLIGADHQIADLIGVSDRIVDLVAFDQHRLRIKQIRVFIHQFRVFVIDLLQCRENVMIRIDFQDLAGLDFILVRHLIQNLFHFHRQTFVGNQADRMGFQTGGQTDFFNFIAQRKYNNGGGTNSSDSSELVFLVFADEAAMLPVQDYLQEGEWETSTRIGVNYAGTLEDRTAFYEALNQKIRSLGPVQYATCLDYDRQEFKSMYGGLLFVGVFFSILFLTATVLIIYFKQISEAMDDREQYIILQKVGMDEQEVSATINRQVMLVFFLPLVTALIHTGFATPLMQTLLVALKLTNPIFTYACVSVCAVIFTIFYLIFYRMTSQIIKKEVAF